MTIMVNVMGSALLDVERLDCISSILMSRIQESSQNVSSVIRFFFLEFIVAKPFVEFDVHIDAFLVLLGISFPLD